jgi:hypothetical protein
MRRLLWWGVGVALVQGACAAGGNVSEDDSATGGVVTGGTRSGGAASTGGRAGSGGGVAGGGTGAGGDSGISPSLEGCSIFPSDNAWNRKVSDLPVHAMSDAYIDSIGRADQVHPDFGTVWDGAPIGIPYVVVQGQPDVEIVYDAYGDESDPGPFPIPLDAPIEGGPDSDGDRHVIAVDVDSCTLYELYRGFPGGDSWTAGSGVKFDLTVNEDHPEGCTSADAAGLPIFPGLVRYDEVVEKGEIAHAIRFTVENSQRAYVYPARHYASDDTNPNLPPMGLRVRMKQSYDCSELSNEAQVVCRAMKEYGMILADNGSNWYVSGAPDSRWNDDALGDLKGIPGDAFEVVDTGDELVTNSPDCSLSP